MPAGIPLRAVVPGTISRLLLDWGTGVSNDPKRNTHERIRIVFLFSWDFKQELSFRDWWILMIVFPGCVYLLFVDVSGTQHVFSHTLPALSGASLKGALA